MGKRPCEGRERDWTNTATSQGMSRTADNYQKLGQSWNVPPFSASERNPSYDILILDF